MTVTIMPGRHRPAQRGRAALWLSRLAEPCRRELYELRLACREGSCPRGVVADWCEEHGGERGFARFLAAEDE